MYGFDAATLLHRSKERINGGRGERYFGKIPDNVCASAFCMITINDHLKFEVPL
jgi:hypothetical protein